MCILEYDLVTNKTIIIKSIFRHFNGIVFVNGYPPGETCCIMANELLIKFIIVLVTHHLYHDMPISPKKSTLVSVLTDYAICFGRPELSQDYFIDTLSGFTHALDLKYT